VFNVQVPEGEFVSATATDPAHNTSEFAACLQVGSPSPPPSGGDAMHRTLQRAAEQAAESEAQRARSMGMGFAEADREGIALCGRKDLFRQLHRERELLRQAAEMLATLGSDPFGQ
jgi:hypothetical protein